MAAIPIRYRDFFDVPRAFVVNHNGSLVLFDCPYDEGIGEYPDHYRVYRLPAELSDTLDAGTWEGLAERGVCVGHVPITLVRFDATRRSSIDDEVFESLQTDT